MGGALDGNRLEEVDGEDGGAGAGLIGEPTVGTGDDIFSALGFSHLFTLSIDINQSISKLLQGISKKGKKGWLYVLSLCITND